MAKDETRNNPYQAVKESYQAVKQDVREVASNAKQNAEDFTSSKEFKDVKKLAKNIVDKEYAELSEIREDLNSLKSNVVALSRHLSQDGKERLSETVDRVKESMSEWRSKGENNFAAIEDSIRDNPRRSLLIAFGVGIIANLLFTNGKKD